MSLPSSPSRFSTRRSVTPSKAKPVDVGNPLGVYDTNSVRDRVRQWQAQGGGVATADDIGGEEDLKLERSAAKIRAPERESTPPTPTRSGKGDVGSITPSRSGRRTIKGDNGKRDRTRSGSAPAKRVVSDGHWRKKINPPKSATSTRTMKDEAPTWATPDDDLRAKHTTKLKTEGTQERDGGRTTKRENVSGDDGIRVCVTSPGSHKHSERSRRHQSDIFVSGKRSGSDLEAIESSPPRESARSPKASTPEKSLRVSSPATKDGPERRRASNQKVVYRDELPRPARGGISERGSIKSHKASVLNQMFGDSRRIFTKQAPEPIPTLRVPSIEAWLNDTSDPFVEADEPPLDFIAPLRPSADKRRSTPKNEEEDVEGPNRIRDALDTKEGTRRAITGSRRKKRIPSSAIYEDNPFPVDFDSDTGLSGFSKGTQSASKFVDLVQESPKISSSSLKRRSARKSVSSPFRDQHRSHVNRESAQDENLTSALSSNHTAFSVEGPDPNNLLKPPGLNLRRPFPTTGQQRLSTIASVETFGTRQGAVPPSVSEGPESIVPTPAIEEDEVADEIRDQFDPKSLKRNNSRLTKHADLISVLSLPKPTSRSIQSARSIRTNRSRLATTTTGDLMRELATDESKYMRELRTLVDGVIPVLLTCVLSKSDSAVAAGLFRPSARTHGDPNFTRPIVDMGIALERLKTLHKRIPQDDPTTFMTWAHGAQRVYVEYLKAWRMGFQDVVVNLAPAAEENSTVSSSPSVHAQGFDEGLQRNENGDVVNGDGERVDVAFLLRRPLVRLKYLQKTLKGINFIRPSAEAELLATKYQKLVDDARQRSNEERARLEDEAASNIDPTRTRDPSTLAPLAGVIIDRSRRVRARDSFNLALQHSSGQCLDCRVELILRDEASDIGDGGDLLVCEVDGTGKWLLFPAVQAGRVSARNGDLQGEIVVMIRGMSGNGSDWQEVLSLRSEDEQAGFEWVQMLGLTPVPPRMMRSQSFLSKNQGRKSAAPISVDAPPTPRPPSKSRTPSPRGVEVPIGEHANEASRPWVESMTDGLNPKHLTPTSREAQPEAYDALPATPSRTSNYVDQVSDLRSLPSQTRSRDAVPAQPTRTPRSFKEALGLSGTSTSVGLKRTRAKRLSRHGNSSSSSPKSKVGDHHDIESHTPSSDATRTHKPAAASTGSPNQLRTLSSEASEDYVASSPDKGADRQKDHARPPSHRSRSSVPSMELPYIPKARKDSPPTTPTFELEKEPEWPRPSDSQQQHSRSKLTKKRPLASKAEHQQESPPPVTATHHSSTLVQLNGSKTPVLGKTQIKQRRSSSPLKHEYEPSTASETSSDSDTSTVEHNEATSVSDSSEDEDEELEEGDAPTPLLPLGAFKRLSKDKPRIRTFSQSTPEGSIKPSESASQAPYKAVPAQPTKACKTIASIFSWSDTGSWQSLHPNECSIVITPGLIEAHEMSAAHSKDVPLSSSTPVVDADAFSDLASNMTSQNDEVQGDRPLVALELTPLVPLRRGTALDISIRSPPTSNSQITSGNNIMFRSRNPEECEALYALINHSRIHNPTFVALQNARASGSPFGADRCASTSANSSRHSWFNGWGRSSSYRASSAPTPSIAPSDSSISSMSSAFSALKRFGKGSGMFNISRSTITSREGSRANSIYTSSDNSSGSGTSSPIPPGLASAGKEAPIGLTNAKIRLYARETASKWRDMGSARLTIIRPEKNNVGTDGRPTSSGAYQVGNEKRIVVTGKTKGEVLLDEQLGETCFERVARTGIAISVWEDVLGPNGEVGVAGAVGGVGGGRARVYMIQMKSEAETAYTFSIVGKLRY